MSYILLAIAIGMEILATTFLKHSEGFSKFIPSIACIVSYIICYYAFAQAIQKINLGVAYATWCGVGIVATALISFFVFKERLTTSGIIGVVFIVIGCIILNIYGSAN